MACEPIMYKPYRGFMSNNAHYISSCSDYNHFSFLPGEEKENKDQTIAAQIR